MDPCKWKTEKREAKNDMEEDIDQRLENRIGSTDILEIFLEHLKIELRTLLHGRI